MERCKRQFSAKTRISTGVNSLTSSLALMAEEGRHLGDNLHRKLQECAYFCHISREPTCIASAHDLPAAASKIRGVKQSRSREELAGGAGAGNSPKTNEGNRGVIAAYPAPRGVKSFRMKLLLSLCTAAPRHSPPRHPHPPGASAHVQRQCQCSAGALLSAIGRGNVIHRC